MNISFKHILFFGVFLLLQPGNADEQAIQTYGVPLAPTFESIYKNIVEVKCLKCHKPGGKAEDLPFVEREEILTGKIDEGPLIVPGKALESAFFKVMNEDPSIRKGLKKMPPRKATDIPPVTPEELSFVKTWIDEGAEN